MKRVIFCLVLSLSLCLGTASFANASGGGGSNGGSGGGNGGGGNGGGTTTGTNPLPQTSPGLGILLRDSFGEGPDVLRPAGGKGTLKETYLGVSIGGFWLEYPGNKNNSWIVPNGEDTWRFCGTATNPYELFSPLQVVLGFENNTILCTQLNAPIISATRPTALMPVPANLTVPYELEVDGTIWTVPNAYLSIGLTSSAVTTNNLANGGNVMLTIKPNPSGVPGSLVYEFRLGGFNGQLLASGVSYYDAFFNQLKIRYNPQTKSVGASFQGTDLGTFATNIAAPKYFAIEGVGYADNFVVRQIQ